MKAKLFIAYTALVFIAGAATHNGLARTSGNVPPEKPVFVEYRVPMPVDRPVCVTLPQTARMQADVQRIAAVIPASALRPRQVRPN